MNQKREITFWLVGIVILFLLWAWVLFGISHAQTADLGTLTALEVTIYQNQHVVYLTWPGSGYSAHWEILRSQVGDGYWGVISSVPINQTDFRDTDVDPGEIYFYQVRRIDDSIGQRGEEGRTSVAKVHMKERN